MNICRKCGAVLREGDKFCSKCGARVSQGRIEARKQNAQKKKQQKEITFRTKPEHSSGYRENFEEGENRSHALLVTVTILVVMMLAVAAFAMFYFFQRRSMAGNSGYGSAIEIISDGASRETVAVDPAAAADPSVNDGQAQGTPASDGQAQGTPASDGQAQGTPASDGQAQGTPASDGQAQTAPASEVQTTDAAAADTAASSEAVSETQAAADAELKAQGSEESQAQETGEETDQGQPDGAPVVSVLFESEAKVQTESETQPQTELPSPKAADVVDPAQIQTILDSESTATSSEVYIYDLKNDSEVSVNDCTQPMYASALITVPILYTAAARIDAGELTMDDPITYVTSIGGRGEMTTESRDGQQLPLSFYLQTMTNYSDNNCTNILIDYLGLDSINSTCQAAGYTSVNMERGLVSGDPGGLDNYVSAKDITMMIRDLFTGKFSSIGEDYMREYFKISESDSLPTMVGLAPSLADATAVLNQNGYGSTRYNETALIEDGGALYIITIMLNGNSGLVYSPAVTDASEYVAGVMVGG